MADIELVIKIPEEVRVAITRMGLLRIPDEMQKEVDRAIQSGTPIPDNATNGDVIKVMFGDDKVSSFMGYVRIMARIGNWFNEGIENLSLYAISCLSHAPTVDVLERIRAEIERLHYHPKLDFIKNDEVVEMALDIIDKYKAKVRNE